MQEPIQSYCRVGFVSFMLWPELAKGGGNYQNIHTLLDDPFFEVIEMTCINDDKERKRVSDEIKKKGKLVAFGSYPIALSQNLDINQLNEAERQKVVAALIDVIPQAYDLKAKGFGLLSGKMVPEHNKEQAFNQLVKSLNEIADALKEQGDIPLVLETFDSLSYAKNTLIGTTKDAVEIAKRVRKKHPDFGLLLDLSHLPLIGDTSGEAIALAKDYLVHAHIGNCIMDKPDHPMNGDKHPPLEDPDGENGEKELTDFLQHLLNVGYLSKETRPVLSFEVCCYKDWTPEKIIAQSKDVLRRAWEQVRRLN